MSNINQRQVQKLLQKLSPQQIQMIKLLELPAVQLEQRVKQEIEENPVLEEEATEENDEQQTKEVPSRNTSPRTIRRGTNITPTIIRRTTRNAPST